MAASAPGPELSRVLEWKHVHDDVQVVKATFLLGYGQSEGLTTAGIGHRFLDMAKANPDSLKHGAVEDMAEEGEGILQLEQALLKFEHDEGPEPTLELDTTMTLVRHEGKVAIISPAAPSSETFKRIDEFGKVVALVAPNVQHWLFLQAYAKQYPSAKVFLSDPALDEDLASKVGDAVSSFERLRSGERQVLPCLDQKYLEGATQAMHEMLFLHEPSQTLITSDAFYPGYPANATVGWRPGWFARAWFKLTKAPHSYTDPTLPIYRTARVASAGSPAALLDSLNWLQTNWDFTSIISAHGFTPYCPDNANAAFRKAWMDGCKLHELEGAA